MRNRMPKTKLFSLLAIILGIFLYIVNGDLNVDNTSKQNPVAEKGVIDLKDWDFKKDGMVKLDGQWEFYKNQLLSPEDFKSSSLDKKYNSIPGILGGQGYGTYRLKILVNNDDFIYSVKIDYLQNAYILWANNRQIASVGKVGKSKEATRAQNLPKASSFYTENGEVYLTLQMSNFYSKFGFIDTVLMGEASEINSVKEKKQALDLFLFGSCLITAIYNLAVFLKRRKERAPLFFSIVCIVVAIRTLFVGQRFIIAILPNFNYILSARIMIWTFYLYIPFIVLFISKNYGEVISRKIVKVSNVVALVYFLLGLITPTSAYITYLPYFEIIGLLIILYMIFKVSKVYIESKSSDYITVVGLFALFITRINDILYEYSIIITNSYAPLGVFVFIIANYYILAEKQSENLSKSEEMSKKLKTLNNLKDDFLAITSHELKTPLNGIIGLSDDLGTKNNNNMSQEQKYNLFLIKSSAVRLSNLVNDIIMFSKLKNNEIKLNQKKIKINKLVEMVIKFCEPSIRNKNIELLNLIDFNVPYIYGDEDRIQQIFYNLLGNSIKFTQEGKIILSYSIKNDYLEISVEDSGIGIPEERLNRIYNIYEQGEGISEKYGGTGLGLYITKNLVKLHGGDIHVSSVVGEGTVFTFTLPLSYEEPSDEMDLALDIEEGEFEKFNGAIDKTNDKLDLDTSSESNKSFKILIVDDEYVNQRVLKNYLSSVSKNIMVASTGSQALEIIEKNKDLDLVILDMMLPDLLGYEICGIIRKKYSIIQLPILIMTADNRRENLVVSFESGANDYLRKPFNREELLSRVSTLLNLKHSVHEALNLAHQVNIANEKIQTLNILNNESEKKVEELIEYDNIKTEFFANISHELRTPLNVISTTIQLLRSLDGAKNLGDERIKYYFNIMNQNALRLIRLINNLIDTTKIEGNYLNANFVNRDIVYVVEEIVQSVADFVKSKNINITFDTEVEEKIIAFDEEKIERIILNLLSNAVKFTDENGSIFINIYDKTDFIIISVKDTGIGIPKDKLEFIFNRFAQVDKSINRKSEGSGIGLAIVKSLVEMHGGSIIAQSKLGVGSEFIISLPARTVELKDIIKSKEIVKPNYKENLEVEFSDIY